MKQHASTEKADVCLLLEGTYPYVKGGVSEWVDQLIRELSDVRFALYFIGSQRKAYPRPTSSLPENVVDFREVFILEEFTHARSSLHRLKRREARRLADGLRRIYFASNPQDQVEGFWTLMAESAGTLDRYSLESILVDRRIWQVMIDVYQAYAGDESFIDYFWGSMFLHLPAFRLFQDRWRIPPARLYHSVSTGYAGWVGAMAAWQTRAPLLVTEHGIYTKERIAEISQADWIHESLPKQFSLEAGLGTLKQMWIDLFDFLGKIAYHAADPIITLSKGNTLLQEEFGAPREKLKVVPNGINPEEFNGVLQSRRERRAHHPEQVTVGFLGRVVPIKDVITWIRAADYAARSCPHVTFLLAGPTGEDEAYYRECCDLVSVLNLGDRLQFLGSQDVRRFLPRIDFLVFSSLSEGMPFGILEAFAAGIPVVATDVGACRELVFGRTAEDKALGRAGLLTRIASPEDTADAMKTLIRRPDQVDAMGRAGRTRVETFYHQNAILDQYRKIYHDLLNDGTIADDVAAQAGSVRQEPSILVR